MPKRWLSPPRPAFVIALVALFIALGGAAYAGGLISGKQIKNHTIAEKKLTKKAIAALRGQRGLRGPAGPVGATGATGATGGQGPAGPITGTLPQGVTLRGFYYLKNTATTMNQEFFQPISFGLQLSSAPTVHVVPSGGPNPSGCSGSASDPGAASGNLCIFEGFGNIGEFDPIASVENQATKFGGVLHQTSTGAGDLFAFGTWAVTG
jgi:hypothetical protein